MSNSGPLPTPAAHPLARTQQSSTAWLIAGLLFYGALPLSFGILRLLQLSGHLDIMPPISASAVPIVGHIAGALTYLPLGAIQFSPAIRRRWPLWHRLSGRLALFGATLVIVSAPWLAVAYASPSVSGLVLAGLRVSVAMTMAAAIALGVAAIRKRDVRRHREWMIRAYAIGLGAATQMLVLMVAEILEGAPTELNRAILMGLAWGINLTVAEVHIRRGRTVAAHLPQGRRASISTHALDERT